MAREFAQIRLTIWSDQDFTNLTPEQQLVFLMLSSQPTINLAGVLDYLPGRLARLSGGLTSAKVGKVITELEDRDFVFLDADTDEILVRSAIRTNGAWKTPNSAQAIALNAQQVMSRKLKSVLLTELQRVIQEAITAGQWEKSRTVLATAAASLEQTGINPWAKGSPNPSPKGLPGDGDGDGDEGDGDGHGAIALHEPDPFDQWWSHWPKKTAKGDAKKAFTKALRAAGLTALCDGADTYASWIDRNSIDDRYVVGPGKWLRDERWTDELADRTPQAGNGRPTATDRMRSAWGLAQQLEAEEQHRLEIGS